MSLQQKVDMLRNELSIKKGDTLAQTIDTAVQELGLKDVGGARSLMQKVDACLETLGTPTAGASAAQVPGFDAYYSPPRGGTSPPVGYGGSLESRTYGGSGGGFGAYGARFGSFGGGGYGAYRRYGGLGSRDFGYYDGHSSYGGYNSYGSSGYGRYGSHGSWQGRGSGGYRSTYGGRRDLLSRMRRGKSAAGRERARWRESATPPVGAQAEGTKSLQQKVDMLRNELSIKKGDTLAQTIDTAVQELGLKDVGGARSLMQKVDACLETLGTPPAGASAAQVPGFDAYYSPPRGGTSPPVGYGGSSRAVVTVPASAAAASAATTGVASVRMAGTTAGTVDTTIMAPGRSVVTSGASVAVPRSVRTRVQKGRRLEAMWRLARSDVPNKMALAGAHPAGGISPQAWGGCVGTS